MDDALELGMEGFDKLVDKHFDKVYDGAQKVMPHPGKHHGQDSQQSGQSPNGGADQQGRSSRHREDDERSRSKRGAQRPRTELPSPERERNGRGDYYQADGRDNFGHNNNGASALRNPPHSSYYDDYYDPQLERQSQTSERVLRDYENERDDPRRKPDPSIIASTAHSRHSKPPRDPRYPSSNMSNGYGYDSRRPTSQQPPRSRHHDDGDSDYDEHTGRVYRKTSRGYDDGYDREIIETERYRGPARDLGTPRSPSFQDSDYQVAAYNHRSGDLAPYDDKRRSRSRGRHDRDSYYGDERGHRDDRSRSRSRSGIRGKIDDTFDTSTRGLGVGLAGAIVGGLAAKQFGDKRNNKRDMVIGAVIGGLGANAAEQKYRDWSDERKGDRREERLSVPSGRDEYRSRSSNR